jgi:hypothetical protein
MEAGMNVGQVIAALVGCLAFGVSGMALSAGCNRHVTCPAICVQDDSEACTRITNSSQACELRKYTCNGCISATASRLGASVACAACVIDTLATTGEAAVSACNEMCGGAAMVEKIVKNNDC